MRAGPTWNDGLDRSCDDPGGQTLDHVLVVPGAGGALSLRGGEIVVPEQAPHPSDHCPLLAVIAWE